MVFEKLRYRRRAASPSSVHLPRRSSAARLARAVAYQVEALEARTFLTAVVLTNQSDYAPGTTAIFTATNEGAPIHNYLPGETIQFHVIRTDGVPVKSPPAIVTWDVIDGVGGFKPYQNAQGIWIYPDLDGKKNGEVETNWYVDPQFLGASLAVTATGLKSGATATTDFTDSAGSITSTISPTTVNTGVATAYTMVVTQTGSGNTESIAINIPAGMNTPTSLSASKVNNKTWTISVVSGQIQVVDGGSGGSGDLTSGQSSITLGFTSTASTSGTMTWTTTAYDNKTLNGNSTQPTTEPTVFAGVTSTTALTRTVGASPSTYGSSLTFHTVVSGTGGTPTGTVQLQVDGSNFGSAATLSGGAANIVATQVPAGSHTITAVYSGDGTFSTSTGTLSGGQTVSPLAVTLTGSRTYDGTTTAAAGILTVSNELSGDTLTLSGSATLAGKNVGSENITSFSGLTLGGASAANYTLTGASGSVTISTRDITVTAATNSKTYDDTTSATATGSITSGSIATGDTAPTWVETYSNKNAGTGLTLTPSGIVNDGNSGNNYSVTFVNNTTGAITAKALTVSGLTAGVKTYDGTTTETIGGTPALQSAESAGSGTTSDGKPYSGDTVTVGGTAIGTFASKDVGTSVSITVTGNTISGAQAGDYTITQQTGLSANITPKALTVSGLTASAKTYDGTTTAALGGTAALQSAETAGSGTTSDGKPYTGDTVTLGGTATGTFASKDVGTPVSITVTGNSISGAQAGDYTLTQQTGLSANITPKALTVSGLTASAKPYDGTTTATLGGTAALQSAETAGSGTTSDGKPYTGDTVTLGGTATGTFASKDVGTPVSITVTGNSISGAQAGDYTLTQQTGLSANITPKALTVSGLTASAKVYDGTTTATLGGTAALQSAETAGSGTTSDGKPYTGDTVTLGGTATGTFASKDVGTPVSITVTGNSISGAQAGDYTLTQQTGLSANITPKALTVSGLTASAKVYDGTTTATLGGTAALQSAETAGSGTTSDGKPYTGDTVTLGGTATGTFASKNVGAPVSITVTGNTISGAQAGDYTLTQQTGLSANITAKALTVSGLTASAKTYDGTTTATLGGTAALQSAETAGSGTTSDGKPYSGDTVTLGGTATGTFASKNVGTPVSITVTGNSISGAQAGDYTLTQQTGLSANITPKALTVSGLTASAKTYDGTTTATLGGTAALQTAESAGSGTTADGKPYSGDTVTLGGTASGTFASKDVGTPVSITVTGNTIGGAQAGDYTLTQQTGLSANITPKALTVSGLTASAKVYDGTTTAALGGTAALQSAESTGSGSTSDGKPYTGDTVTLGGTAAGTFASKDVGTPVSITVTGNGISGAQAGDYTLTQQTGLSANITPKALTVSGLTASAKVYDGTTTATLGGTAALQSAETSGSGSTSDGKPYTGDTVTLGGTATGTFASKDVGTPVGITVTGNTISGAQAGDYTLTQQTGLSANITPKALTVGGLTASAKTYDGTTTATLGGTAALPSAETAGSGSTSDGKPYSGDTVSLGGTATGTFASKDVGTPVSITVTGNTISGTQASDYTLTQQTGLSANITPKALTVSGLTASAKTYDGTTAATLGGTAALQAAESAGSGTTSDGKPYSGDTVSLGGTATGTFASKDVGTPVSITVTDNTISGTQAGDYTITQQAGLSANITPKALTESGLSVPSSKVYDGTTAAVVSGSAALQSAESTGSGSSSDGKPYSGDTVSVAGTATGTYNSKDVATASSVTFGGLSLGGAQAGDYTLTLQSPASATITAKALAESGLSVPSSKVYDDTTAAVVSGSAALQSAESAGSGSTSDGKPYSGDTVSVSGTPTGTYNSKDVATASSVTFGGLSLTGAQAGDYTLTLQSPASATITPYGLTVSGLSASNKVYDSTTAATITGTGSLIGVFNGDAVSLSGTPGGTFASKDVANGIAVSVSGLTLGGAQAGDYSLTEPTLAADITPFGLTVSGLAASNKVYDSTTATTITGTGSLVGVFNGDTVSLSGTPSGTFAAKDVANGISVSVSGLGLGGAQAGDYSLTGPTLAANITPYGLTVSGLSASNKVYDSTTAATITGTGSLVGVFNGDAVSLSGSPGGTFASKDVANGISVSVSGLSLGGTQAGDYSLAEPTLAANITPFGLTVTGLAASNKVYDSTTNTTITGTGSLVGVFNGDAVSLSGTPGGTFASKDVANGIAVSVSGLTLGGAQAGDYSLAEPTLAANITPFGLTVTGLAASNKVYDSTTNTTITGTGSLGGVFNGDSVSLSGTPSGTFASKDVANGISVSVSGLTLGGAQAGDYSLTEPTLAANITPYGLTVSGLSASNKVYDSTTAATITGTGSLVGVFNGDAVSLSGTPSGTFASKDVANGISVSVSALSLGGAQAGDYSLTQPTLAANITPYGLTVSGLSASNKVYDSTTVATITGTGSLVGVFNGDAVSLSGTPGGTFASKDVANGISVSVSGLTLGGAQAGDYSLAEPTLAANITPFGLTVTGLAASNKVYDSTTNTTITGTGSLGGVFNGDSVSLSGTPSGTFASKDVANGISVSVSGLTLGGAQAGDYSLTEPTLAANITPYGLTVSGLSASNKVYDSTTAATITGTASLVGVFNGDAVSLSGTPSGTFVSKDVANGIAVSVSGMSLGDAQAGDYSLTEPTLAANITPFGVTVSGLSASNKVYDSTTAATITGTGSLVGTFGGDAVGLSGTPSGTFVSKDVANGISVSVSGLSLGGPQAGDYSLTEPTLAANITPFGLTASGLSASNKVYDSTTAATITGTGSLVGVFNGDTVSLSGTPSGTFASKDVANGISVSVSGLSLGGAQAGDYSLTQPTLAANITPFGLTVSGLSASSKVYDSTTAATITGTGSLVGVFNGDTVSLSGTPSGIFASKDVANSISVSISGLSLGGAQAGDYSLTQPTLAANITPKALTISIVGSPNKTYDGTTAATLAPSNFSIGGLIGSESFTVTQSAGTYNSKDVTTANTVSASLSSGNFTAGNGTLASDYTLPTTATGAGSITAKAISYTISNDSQTYGSPANLATDLGTTISTGINGENLGITYASTGDVATAAVGGYAITGTLSNGSGQLSDYTVTLTNGTLTVNKAALMITANSTSKAYGTALTLGTSAFTTSGLVNGNTVTGVTLTSAGAAANASASGSPYAIMASAATGTGLSNYNVTYINGTLTVNPLDLTSKMTVKPGGFVYNFATKLFSQTLTITNNTGSTLTGDIALELKSLTSGVTLSNPTGSISGNPYTDVSLGQNGLAAGASISVTLYFIDPSMTGIQYTLGILAGL